MYEKTLIGTQNKSNKKIKQNDRKQKRESVMDDHIDLADFFELTYSN